MTVAGERQVRAIEGIALERQSGTLQLYLSERPDGKGLGVMVQTADYHFLVPLEGAEWMKDVLETLLSMAKDLEESWSTSTVPMR